MFLKIVGYEEKKNPASLVCNQVVQIIFPLQKLYKNKDLTLKFWLDFVKAWLDVKDSTLNLHTYKNAPRKGTAKFNSIRVCN